MAGTWNKIGCYKNKGDEEALLKFADFGRKQKKGSAEVKQQFCGDQAKAKGYSHFSVTDVGCHGSKQGDETYDKYGKSTSCEVDGGFGVGDEVTSCMFVYKLKE